MKLSREFLDGEKEQGKMDEDGLGVALVNIELMTVVPVTVLEYVGTRRGCYSDVTMN